MLNYGHRDRVDRQKQPWLKIHAREGIKKGYTLFDSRYFGILAELTSEFDREKIPYVVCGGAAVQIWIASFLSKSGNLKEISERLIFRPTKDIDLALKYDDAISFFNRFVLLHEKYGATHNSAGLIRFGDINITYEISADELSGFERFYEDIISSAVMKSLRKGNTTLDAKVPAVEYIVALKVTRNRERDIVDVHNLLTAMAMCEKSPDLEWIRSILEVAKKEEAMSRVNEVYSQIYG